MLYTNEEKPRVNLFNLQSNSKKKFRTLLGSRQCIAFEYYNNRLSGRFAKSVNLKALPCGSETFESSSFDSPFALNELHVK